MSAIYHCQFHDDDFRWLHWRQMRLKRISSSEFAMKDCIGHTPFLNCPHPLLIGPASHSSDCDCGHCRFLQCVLSYTSQLSKLLDEKASQGDGGDSKFWKILLKKSYLVVDKVSVTWNHMNHMSIS